MIERIDRTGQLDKSHSFDYTTNRRGADCKGQLSIPHVKRLTARVGELLGGQSFFVIIVFHLGKLCHDLKGQMDHIHDQTQQCEDEREKCESLQQSHSISLPSPSRLRAGHFKKVSSRNPCLFYVKIEKQRRGIESMTTNFAISALLLF